MSYYQAGGALDDFLKAGGLAENPAASGYPAATRTSSSGKVTSIAKALGIPHRRHHRMNPGNVRALRRAMRRVQSFAKLAKHTIGFTHRVHMKKHRRRS